MIELPNLINAPWLTTSRVRKVLKLVNGAGETGRVVGGAVRDELMGRPVTDIDFATTMLPEDVMKAAEAAGIKAIPTGIEHGTVTLVVDGRGHEVTTLREDVETDGRHAVVRFGRDWETDARRRDFTINALSADGEGTVYDPVGGYPDIVERRVRFIGDPDQRIAEDHLRILRFFRFHAECGAGGLDPVGLAAAIRGRAGLRRLAAERTNHELRRLFLADGAAATVETLAESGLLQIILASVTNMRRLERMVAFEEAAGLEPSYPRRLASLAVMVAEDAERVANRLRLANADRDVFDACVTLSGQWREPPDEPSMKEAIYRIGRERVADGLAYAAAVGRGSVGTWAKRLKSLKSWTVPKFPLSGKDLLAKGVARGPEIGNLLGRLEAWWIGRDFAPDRAELLAQMQRMTAAQQ